MTQALFDTQSAVDELKRGGFSEEQAKANVRFVRDALEGGVATRADVERLELSIQSEVGLLRSEVQSLRGEMRAELKAFRFQIIAAVVGASGLLGLFLRLTS